MVSLPILSLYDIDDIGMTNVVHFVHFVMVYSGDDDAAANSGPFLQEDIMSLKGLEAIAEQPEPVQSVAEPVTISPPPAPQEPKPAGKKPTKPKWLKM